MRYLEIDFPGTSFFWLVDDGGVPDGPFETASFVRGPDGAYVASTAGRPVFLRCVRREGTTYVCVDRDGEGDELRYRLVGIDDPVAPGTWPAPHIVAVDWSGRASGEREAIWIAETDQAGRICELSSGWTRESAINRIVAIADLHPRTVAGLDFAFAFPAWWAKERGWTTGPDIWRAAHDEGETWLKACAPPFWGRPGRTNPNGPGEGLRQTDGDLAAAGSPPKSVFQIGGAGAVGTGSVRGMPQLLRLARAGFSIWPFDDASGAGRVAVEIYPRALTGRVNKSSWRARLEYLYARFPEQPEFVRERAAGSEDAFDAAVSALIMHRHRQALGALPPAPDAERRLEGQIWRPASRDRDDPLL